MGGGRLLFFVTLAALPPRPGRRGEAGEKRPQARVTRCWLCCWALRSPLPVSPHGSIPVQGPPEVRGLRQGLGAAEAALAAHPRLSGPLCSPTSPYGRGNLAVRALQTSPFCASPFLSHNLDRSVCARSDIAEPV